ncbi:MAG: four helix bundle protein [Cytophagaceae bacterium]
MINQSLKQISKRDCISFTLKLIEFIDVLPKDNVTKRLSDQLLRSGTSVIANYVEGQAGSSKKDFTNYFNIALKSSNESKLWLCLLRDTKRTKSENVEWLIKELDEISKILAKSILTLKSKK